MKHFYNIAYNGIDPDDKIDCLEAIRRQQNPPGHTTLDVSDLCKSKRNTREDALKDGPLVPGKFVDIGKIDYEGTSSSKNSYKDSLKVDIQPKPFIQNTSTSENIIIDKDNTL